MFLYCGCIETDEPVHVCGQTYCVTRQNYIDFIVTAFADVDVCVSENVDAVTVDFFMQMAESEFNNQELVFLRTYQSVAHNLMACYAYQYDITERRGESHSQTEGKSNTDSYRQVQATGSSYTSDIQGSSARYNDFSRASMDATAERNGCSHSDSYGIATMDDSGEGSKRGRARRRSILKAHHNAIQHQENDTSSSDISTGRGSDYSHSYDATAEDHVYKFILSVTEIGKHGHSTREMSDRTASEGTTTGVNEDWSVARTRKISLDGVRRDSCGGYRANTIGASKDQAQSDSSNTYHAERSQRQRAEGQGYQRGSQDASTQSAMQSNDSTHKETEAKKTNTSWRFSTIRSFKNSQKYQALDRLYGIIQAQIEEGLRRVGISCSPVSSAPGMQPFLSNANYGNENLTIDRLLWRFPYLNHYTLL